MLRTIIASILLLMAVNQALAQMEPPEPYYDQQRKTWEYPLPLVQSAVPGAALPSALHLRSDVTPR